MTLAVDLINKGEGFEPMPYKDTRGNWTIGFGTLLPLSEEEAALLRDHRMLKNQSPLRALFRNYDALGLVRQAVLQSMIYNLGMGGLAKFVKFRAAVEVRDWETAAKEMQNSLWATQVGERAQRLARLMRTGKREDANLPSDRPLPGAAK